MSEDVLQVRVVKILGIENTCICMLKFSPFSKLGLKQQLFQNNLGDLHFKEDTQHSCTYLKYIITESNLFHMFCFVVIWFWTTNNILHESYNLQTEENSYYRSLRMQEEFTNTLLVFLVFTVSRMLNYHGLWILNDWKSK